jgi:hypothetical protein
MFDVSFNLTYTLKKNIYIYVSVCVLNNYFNKKQNT